MWRTTEAGGVEAAALSAWLGVRNGSNDGSDGAASEGVCSCAAAAAASPAPCCTSSEAPNGPGACADAADADGAAAAEGAGAVQGDGPFCAPNESICSMLVVGGDAVAGESIAVHGDAKGSSGRLSSAGSAAFADGGMLGLAKGPNGCLHAAVAHAFATAFAGSANESNSALAGMLVAGSGNGSKLELVGVLAASLAGRVDGSKPLPAVPFLRAAATPDGVDASAGPKPPPPLLKGPKLLLPPLKGSKLLPPPLKGSKLMLAMPPFPLELACMPHTGLVCNGGM